MPINLKEKFCKNSGHEGIPIYGRAVELLLQAPATRYHQSSADISSDLAGPLQFTSGVFLSTNARYAAGAIGVGKDPSLSIILETIL